MGTVTHWVHKINWSSVAVAGVCAAAFVSGMTILADSLKDRQTQITVQITNEGNKPVVKAYHVKDGKLVPVP